MRLIRAPVSTIGIGMVASMASILLAGGEKGKRFALPNTRVMIHQPSGGARGQITDMEIQVAEGRKAKENSIAVLSEFTGRPAAELRDAMERDTFMSASEAASFGLIDEIMGRK
jgi:ATP-dependent Clp protease protease subunit